MRIEATRICRALMQAVADDKLVFRSDLHVVTGLELAISHMIFFHPHEGGLGTKAINASEIRWVYA